MNCKEHIASPSDMITQIKVTYETGHLNEAYELIEQIEKDSFTLSAIDEMKLTMIKGIVLIKRGEYKPAEKSMLRSLELANTYGDTRLRCNRYDNLVAIYTCTKQVHHAIDYLKKSMELKESAGNELDIVRSQLQLASLMFSIEDFESGREALQRANKIIAAIDDISIKIQYLFSNTILLKWEKKYAESLAQYDQIISYVQTVNDTFLETRAYINQGDLLMIMGQWENAKNKFNSALKIAQESHLATDELFICLQLGTIALKQNNLKRCRELYDYIVHHKDLTQDDEIQEKVAELGSHLYEAEGEYTAALKSYRRYIGYYKKHYDNEQTRTVLYIKARYESEKKERELQETKLRQVESELKALQAEQALKKNEKRFKALVENGSEMLVILDADLNAVYASPYIYKTMGYTKDDLETINVFDTMHPEDIKAVMENLKIAQASPGVPVYAQFRFPQKDGKYRWMETTTTNMLQDETVNGIICNIKDIMERKQSEEAIQELNKSLEIKITERTIELTEAVKDLEAFSYSVSHDLRSPLRVITGYARLLLTDHQAGMNSEAREFIDTILDNSKRMGQLIDDLLNFSRMGRKAIYKSAVNMTQMVTEIVTEVQKADDSTTKNIIIHELAPAHCDMAMTKQVWINLVSNAIKYSGKKSKPVIEIGSIPRFNETIYYIKDNGAGFDMRFAKNLFGVFKRLHDRADYDGTGVGLALAHRIIRMHEGRIWAEAEVGKGATFFFTLGHQSE
jgi:PAS domain S-box-containing protein